MISTILILAMVAESPNWSKVSIAATEYTARPTEANAKSLLDLLPDRMLTTEERPSKSLFEKLYGLIIPLEPNVLHGRSADIRLAIRLIWFSDGAFTEELLILFGELSSHRPETFLREIKFGRLVLKESGLDLMKSVVAVNPESDLEESRKTLLDRQRSLLSVSQPDLLSLRDECLAILKSEIKKQGDGA